MTAPAGPPAHLINKEGTGWWDAHANRMRPLEEWGMAAPDLPGAAGPARTAVPIGEGAKTLIAIAVLIFGFAGCGALVETDHGSGFFAGALWGLAVLVYFLPSITAYGRKARIGASVLLVNVFLGWTLVGWVVAFAMAAGGRTKDEDAKPAPLPAPASAAPVVSPDGKSYWNGQAWLPMPTAPVAEESRPS